MTLAITVSAFFGFSTSFLKPLHGFASNVDVPWVDPTKFVKIGVLLLFFMELWAILSIFGQFLKNL